MVGEYKRLLAATGQASRFLALLMLRAPFDAASTIINAVFLQNAFLAVNQGGAAALALACAVFGIASLCLFLYNGVVWSLYAPFCVRMESRLRIGLFEKIASLSCERVEMERQGEWITRLNTDVEMPFSCGFHLPHAACAVVNIGVSAIILWRFSPAVLGWVMLFVLPHILFSQLCIARAMPGLTQNSLKAKAANTDSLTALIVCADIATLYDAKAFLFKRFEESSLVLMRANMKIRARQALSAGIMPLFGLSGYLVLLSVASGWIAAGQFTFGDLAAVFQYRGGVLSGSLALCNCIISIQASMAGISRINETLSEQTEE